MSNAKYGDEIHYSSVVQDQLNTLRAEMIKIQEDMHPLEKRREEIWGQIKNIKEEQDKLIIQNGTPTWEWVLFCDGVSGSMERYRYCENRLVEIGLYDGGYFPETEQKAITIHNHVVKEDRAKVINGIKTILPFMKPVPKSENRADPDGSYKRFHLVGEDCSENGSRELLISDTEVIYGVMYYHRWTQEKRFPISELDIALNWVFDELLK